MAEDVRISARATAAQRSAWQAAAHAMGMTPSEYVRRAIEAQMRADCEEAADAARCAHIVLSAAQDAGGKATKELFRYGEASLRHATLVAALEDFRHG